MNERAWSRAWKAGTLPEAHEALVGLRPLPEAARSVWVTYFLRSSSVYRRVAEVDQDHQGHARYWADREKAKADKLTTASATAESDAALTVRPRKKRRSKGSEPGTFETAVVPTSLEHAHEVLRTVQPAVAAGPEWWLAYHRHAAAVYAEMAEVDRAHHHEALFWAGSERDKAAGLAGQIDEDSETRGEPVAAHYARERRE